MDDEKVEKVRPLNLFLFALRDLRLLNSRRAVGCRLCEEAPDRDGHSHRHLHTTRCLFVVLSLGSLGFVL